EGIIEPRRGSGSHHQHCSIRGETKDGRQGCMGLFDLHSFLSRGKLPKYEHPGAKPRIGKHKRLSVRRQPDPGHWAWRQVYGAALSPGRDIPETNQTVLLRIANAS